MVCLIGYKNYKFLYKLITYELKYNLNLMAMKLYNHFYNGENKIGKEEKQKSSIIKHAKKLNVSLQWMGSGKSRGPG